MVTSERIVKAARFTPILQRRFHASVVRFSPRSATSVLAALLGVLVSCASPASHPQSNAPLQPADLVGSWQVTFQDESFRLEGAGANVRGQGVLTLEENGRYVYRATLEEPSTVCTANGPWRLCRSDEEGAVGVCLDSLKFVPDCTVGRAIAVGHARLDVEGTGARSANGRDLYLFDPAEHRMLCFTRTAEASVAR